MSDYKQSNYKQILNCPFCGKPPEQIGSGEGQRGLMIHCITDGCVNPHVSYYEHAAAISRWNSRPKTGARTTSERLMELKLVSTPDPHTAAQDWARRNGLKT